MRQPYTPIGRESQGRAVPTLLREADLDRMQFRRDETAQRRQERANDERVAASMSLPDLLLAKGSMSGPYRAAHPARNRPVRRFFRAVLAFLLAPRPYL